MPESFLTTSRGGQRQSASRYAPRSTWQGRRASVNVAECGRTTRAKARRRLWPRPSHFARTHPKQADATCIGFGPGVGLLAKGGDQRFLRVDHRQPPSDLALSLATETASWHLTGSNLSVTAA